VPTREVTPVAPPVDSPPPAITGGHMPGPGPTPPPPANVPSVAPVQPQVQPQVQGRPRQPVNPRPPEVAAVPPRQQPRPPVGLRPISAAECQRLPVNDPSRFFQIRELCQHAAEGSVVASYQLGVMYADGQGVPVRRELAVRLLSVAASRGLRPAQQRLEQMGYAVGQ
jgi:hypothetical protein